MMEALAIVFWLCAPPIMKAEKRAQCESYYSWCLRKSPEQDFAKALQACVKARKGKL